ncbi:dihydrolipoamide acetyltransferase family protein [Hydrogenophaga sp.]|uniref:dihydrolipoamide acetyltransferase family protein n=1 Tax=Hydrogenophaga sp. TaxID=1904254 RepID=UPI0025C3A190|nr:dihydrolipoamide acetyltransferase family protein [Hydrogenophaga sp.]
MAEFLMPSLGADMETGKVVEWLVKPGDRVRSGDVVAVVETHKGAIDVEIFLDGVIDQLVGLNEELAVGAVLAQVHPADERAVPKAAEPPAQVHPAPDIGPSPARPVAVPMAKTGPAAGSAEGDRQRVSPAARRRARDMGLDLSTLRGTGVGGAVTIADVERAGSGRAANPPSVPASAPLPRARTAGFDTAQMRQAIAAAMSRSKREIPHYYLSETVDFTAAREWLEAWNQEHPPEQRLLSAVLLLKAAALALKAVPQLNGFYEQNAFQPGEGIHIGWAIALRGGGLVAPAIHDVDLKTLPELMLALRDLVQRARAGGLRSSELTDPTVTVTSLGDRGAESVLGVIYPPQVAIIGLGRVLQRPWVVDGHLAVRSLVTATLAADHRASDGHLGGQLLAALQQALQSPEAL